MRRILILGGTRFFGKRLVERLLEDSKNEVTILTRGETSDPFGDLVHRIQVDRSQPEAFAQALGDTSWDVVYDNICFSPDEADQARRIFDGKTTRYILTSSLSVYDFSEQALTEEVFDPETHPIRYGGRNDFTYQEGKRLAEAVLIQQANFPVAAVRFPIVLGTDDYTRRLHFHIEHVRNELPIGIPNPDANICFIRSDEAADFLYWLGNSTVTGPLNACSDGTVSIKELISLIEKETRKQAVIQSETADAHNSPFGITQSWFMDTAKAQSEGYKFLTLSDWLPELVSTLNQTYED
ncbi:NAD-dependent epimerase/dehydratase family protein [Paenibacillus odorifer]|uniref:NAD-dependent epimerase/dehydratase family protein n=1 Tax=Paenibacillus TaxID=44249 RepID=UPI00096FBCE0|nr:NAD-dependent epimerase/dehydratase family protein [Paenibacillus odorifer]OMD18275.1 NAD-dependent dehydratase [Paenibacillus odorifer]OME24819.1 NAD-dependent dehydratase [Paenibacillus odorifer]OME38185.1 NAD-dependent dehydratase [Paenibacillus odorifer]OME41645.1 NAD-dependent dehydratase [Paenibacillus odorifer]OME49396.1 NAD-dependent dehydratase [Paenibacillus odorifer]